MNFTTDQSLQLEIDNQLENFRKNEYEVSKDVALSIIKKIPNHILSWKILGVIYSNTGQSDEALIASQEVLKLAPQDPESHNNLGVVLFRLSKLEEAEKSYNKAIELKPDYAEAYNNLADVLKDFGKIEAAVKNYKKAIELRPHYVNANSNLNLILKQKKLLINILHEKKIIMHSFENIHEKVSELYPRVNTEKYDTKLIPNPFISNRKVESDLITKLYAINSRELLNNKNSSHLNSKDARYGNGRCSDFQLLENNSTIIKTVTDGLTKIMSQAVKSNIHIMDSFFNIYRDGSGSVPHAHIDHFDKIFGLNKQKYSLTYYLSVGDQDCSEPGILKLYGPNENILPVEGMIVIMPSDRMHSAVYSGKLDRVMIGINFYCLL